MNVITLTGYCNTGKSTAASIIRELLQGDDYANYDTGGIRHLAEPAYSWLFEHSQSVRDYFAERQHLEKGADWIWGQWKENLTNREKLQNFMRFTMDTLGEDAFCRNLMWRVQCDENIWGQERPAKTIIIPDLRRPYEDGFFRHVARSTGGIHLAIRIHTEDERIVNYHESESYYDELPVDADVLNSKREGQPQLQAQLEYLLKKRGLL